MAFTKKMEQYCQEYVKCYNKTKAYQAVCPEMNDKAASASACRLMKREDVMNRIKELQREYTRSFGDMGEFLAKELTEDIAYRDENGKKSPTWSQSINLLQKQFGLQTKNLDVNATAEISINIGDDDED